MKGGRDVKRWGWILAALVVLAGLAATVRVWQRLERGAFRPPVWAAQEEPPPRVQGLEDLTRAREEKLRSQPYEEAEYRQLGKLNSRVVVWVLAQLHLLFAAFVLAVPIFAFIIEAIGYATGDRRYDRLAHDFTKLLSVSFSLTATFGAFLTFMLVLLYPKFMNYLFYVFSPTLAPYVGLFFLEAIFLYTYYYGWGKFHPLVHLGLGLGLNIVGTAIMFIANAWLSFMMSPGGVSETGVVLSVWDAFANFTWMPINIHRLIANVAFGGSVAAAYGAWMFLHAHNDEERAHYDWMGYTGNFVATIAFLPLPFAGYWLASEIYNYNQALGIMMMGGAFRWLFIIQAVLIGMIFLAANYYLWVGMGRIEGERRYQGAIKYLLAAIALCFAVWVTPRAIVATGSEIRAMGGTFHPVLRWLGLMSAKNTAVNILILTTFISFVLYLRAGKRAASPRARLGDWVQATLIAAAAAYVIYLGVYGYFVEASIRIRFSVYMVLAVLIAIVGSLLINIVQLKGAMITAQPKWGKMPLFSQYVLIFIAVSFTWLMGLMGYVRSGLRQHWHVYGVMRDHSPDAYTPTLGYATKIVSVTVLLFFALIGFVFWLASLAGKKAWAPASEPVLEPAGGWTASESDGGH